MYGTSLVGPEKTYQISLAGTYVLHAFPFQSKKRGCKVPKEPEPKTGANAEHKRKINKIKEYHIDKEYLGQSWTKWYMWSNCMLSGLLYSIKTSAA